MKLVKYMAYAFAAAAIATGLTACGDDDKEEEGGGTITPPGEVVEGVLTPEESKEFLEDAANDFLGLFNAKDQRQLADLADHVADSYGNLEAPANWDEADASFAPAAFTRAMAKAYRTGSYAPVSRGAYIYRFGDYTGVYEPGSKAWVKTANSNDIIFRFKGPKGDCELKATADKGEWDINFEEEDYYYSDRYTVKVPGRVHVTLTEAGKSLVDITVESNANTDSRVATINVNATIMNLGLVASFNASNSELAETQTLSINGTPYQTSTATVKGKNMLTDATIEGLEDERIALGDVLTSATATVDIMGNVQVKADASNFTMLADCLEDNYWDSWDFKDKAEAEKLCRRACDNFNKCVNGRLYYTGTNDVQGTLIAMPSLWEDSYYNEWEWYMNAGIKFGDDSTQSMEDFFDETDFSSVMNNWESVINAYKRVWDIF